MSKKNKKKPGRVLDPKRIAKVKALAKAGKSQRAIARILKMAQSSVSRHFNVGRKAPLRKATRFPGDLKKAKARKKVRPAKKVVRKAKPKAAKRSTKTKAVKVESAPVTLTTAPSSAVA